MRPRPLRILHVTTSFPRCSEDHSGIFVSQLVQALTNEGLICRVLTPASSEMLSKPGSNAVHRFRYAPSKWQRIAQQPGGIPQTLAQYPSLHSLLPGFLTSMAFSIIRLAKTHDAIHAHWSVCGSMAALTRPFHGKPIITTLRGSDTQLAKVRGTFAWINRKAVLGSRFTVGVSNAIVRDLRHKYPTVSDRFALVPNGVADSFFSASPSSRPAPPPLKILFVGSLVPNKGVDILLRALACLEEGREWQLSIAGDGPEMHCLRLTAQALRLSERVVFLGAVPPSDMPSLMTNHHVLVLPSYKEGRPNVVLEAMASSLPVVATEIDGTKELVQSGRTGWLFPSGNFKALAEVIRSLLQGEKDLVATGAAGRQWMLDRGLTWAYTAQRYRELYEQTIMSSESFGADEGIR